MTSTQESAPRFALTKKELATVLATVLADLKPELTDFLEGRGSASGMAAEMAGQMAAQLRPLSPLPLAVRAPEVAELLGQINAIRETGVKGYSALTSLLGDWFSANGFDLLAR